MLAQWHTVPNWADILNEVAERSPIASCARGAVRVRDARDAQALAVSLDPAHTKVARAHARRLADAATHSRII